MPLIMLTHKSKEGSLPLHKSYFESVLCRCIEHPTYINGYFFLVVLKQRLQGLRGASERQVPGCRIILGLEDATFGAFKSIVFKKYSK